MTQTREPHSEPGAELEPRAPGLGQSHGQLAIRTKGTGFVDITGDVRTWLGQIGARDGLITLFIRHTSASLTIQENADPDVLADLKRALDRLAPEDAGYAHTIEGPDDMPAHVKSLLTATSLSIPVQNGRVVLGTWQAIYVAEHRARPHDRLVALHYVGTLG